jgi:serine/threonine-protein kinase
VTSPPERLSAALADRYRLERELGAGGMATVYLAYDTRHDRKVAVKVLRPELAAIIGAERFLAEIKTTAALQHPHILPLLDSGLALDDSAEPARRRAAEYLYYVMPLIEGESLRDRLMREKQLPVDDAVRLAREVASALDYAHRHGVVHRDIKPENILLHDGQALVADFGIALAASKAGGTRMTETGMSLGTPTYMSPEQAMGEREITGRSDVYALGVVLYEMLTGEPPFTGPTAQAIVAKVVTEAARPLAPQRRTVPPHVEAAVLRAVEKLPADRFATAAEFAAAVGGPADRRTGGPGVARRSGHRSVTTVATISTVATVATAAGLALGALAVWALSRPAPPPVIRYGLALPASQTPDPNWMPRPSPDGTRLAFVGPAEGGVQLWLKSRDRHDASPLLGTAGVVNFAWSPDGQWIAFTQELQLRKVPVQGGAAVTLADSASNVPGLVWLDDGTIVFLAMGGGRGLRQVSADGGAPTVLLADSMPTFLPSPLPDDRGVLFTRCASSCALQENVWALDRRTGRAHEVVAGAAIGFYAPTGHLVYVRQDGAMLAVPFNLRTLRAEGSPVPLLDSVSVVARQVPMVALSSSGTLVLRLGSGQSLLEQYQMVWVDRTGRETPMDPGWTFRMTEYGGNIGWSLSPDGSRLAIGLSTTTGDDIWVKQLPRGPLSRVSFDAASEFRPRWLADGRTIMFGSNRAGFGTGGLYRRAANGTGEDTVIRRAPTGIFEGAWTPDGQWLLFRTGGVVAQSGGRDIVGARAGDTTTVPVVVTPYDEEAIALSPDGRWLAYESNETGRTEIFLRPFPATESGKWQVSNDGGVAPLWARNGRELFYVSDQRELVAVGFTGSAEPRLGEPRPLFRLRDEIYMTGAEFYTPFDVAPDGRFIMARSIARASDLQQPLVVVENWFEELRRKVGR